MMRILILAGAVLLSGCIMTRSQLKEQETKKETQSQVVAMQQARYQDMDAQMRQLNGRIEMLEHALQVASTEKQQLLEQRELEKADNANRLRIYEEALNKLEQQYLALAQKVEALEMKKSTSTAARKPAPKNSFNQGEEEFKKKNFQNAIASYQQYREANPKGKNYAEATYKMGVAFQELGMKQEALPFFNEVIEKFPKSKSAEKAKIRLKQLK